MGVIESEKGYNFISNYYYRYYELLDSFDYKVVRETLFNRINNILKTYKKVSLCDAGCGDGRILKRLNRKFNNKIDLVGIDISEKMLKIAEKKVKNCRFFKVNLEKSDESFFSDFSEYFDVVISFFTLVHIGSPDIFFSNIYKILKPGGFLIFNNIPQKKSPLLKVKNKHIKIISYDHRDEHIEMIFFNSRFKLLKKHEIKELNMHISTIYELEKLIDVF